ncbi:beta-1,4-galactosyltransferase 5-like [Diadema antillarum]|uniref:beta-1,4-galactosyltransferase 5-like n=1 Tax=Diadema antillarum TaxID=105358 RepID=UPI003A8AD389
MLASTLESPSSYFRSRRSLTKGLRDMMQLPNVSGGLQDLFVIQPAQSFREQMREQDKIIEEFQRREDATKEKEAPSARNTSYNIHLGPFTCTGERPVCPELDIPGLVGKRKVDLRDSPMSESKKKIFGAALEEVSNAVKRANQILSSKLDSAKTANITNVDWLFDSAIESQAIGINNYWYLPGGHWKPMNCLPRWKVAIIIPFRDRNFHLPIVLKYLIPMLQRQLLEFSFFIIEQANQDLFNRAMLMNVGFLEALNFTNYDCFIFHDVDHVPLDDHNYYGCSGMPRHFLSGADRWKYKLPYDAFFGAVSGLTKGQIRQINGFPNVYWGWGGEDDEIWNRMKDSGLAVSRPKGPVGHFDVIKHHHKSAPFSKERHGLLSSFKGRYKNDGLNDIVYRTPNYTFNELYTNVSVDIKRIKPHYPMPAPKGVKKSSQKELMQKMADLTLKAKPGKENPAKKGRSGPAVRKPDSLGKSEESPQGNKTQPEAKQLETKEQEKTEGEKEDKT